MVARRERNECLRKKIPHEKKEKLLAKEFFNNLCLRVKLVFIFRFPSSLFELLWSTNICRDLDGELVYDAMVVNGPCDGWLQTLLWFQVECFSESSLAKWSLASPGTGRLGKRVQDELRQVRILIPSRVLSQQFVPRSHFLYALCTRQLINCFNGVAVITG